MSADRSPSEGPADAALTDALRRLDEVDGEIGAFVDVLRDRARSDATELDGRGTSRGPLTGVPIAIKELFDVAGGDNSYGSEIRTGRRATTDATLVARLRAAGALVVGLTRSHEFGWGITTQHTTRGSTRNPWDLERVPGGSSGGSAAAVSSGIVTLAVGSDTGGSIRIPAAYCGVLGLKTTPGRITRAGGVALAPTFDTPGFLARSITLLSAGLAAVIGPDASDPITLTAPTTTEGFSGGRFRFSIPTELHPFEISQARSAALARLAAALGSIDGEQVDVTVPNATHMYELFVPHQMAEAHYVHTTTLGTWPRDREKYGTDVSSRLTAAGDVSVSDYVEAVLEARVARSRFVAAFDDTDFVVSLVGSTGPSWISNPDVVTVDGRLTALRDSIMPSTVPQNIAGLPSLTVPVGVDEEGMPIGIQITGPPWSEQRLLDLGKVLEQLQGFVVESPLPGNRAS